MLPGPLKLVEDNDLVPSLVDLLEGLVEDANTDDALDGMIDQAAASGPQGLEDVLRFYDDVWNIEGDDVSFLSYVVYLITFADPAEAEDILVEYANDERLSVDERIVIGSCLGGVWQWRDTYEWDAFNALKPPARAAAMALIPREARTAVEVAELHRLIQKNDQYPERLVTETMFRIRNTISPDRDDALAALAVDDLLSEKHRGLAAEMVATRGRMWTEDTDVGSDTNYVWFHRSRWHEDSSYWTESSGSPSSERHQDSATGVTGAPFGGANTPGFIHGVGDLIRAAIEAFRF